MNTKLIMTVSAAFLALLGVVLTFFPVEIAGLVDISSPKNIKLILQLLGSLYFSFAMLNWMAKGSIIGGIYNKPIAMANFTQFLIGGLALIKVLINDHHQPGWVWGLTAIYSIFAFLFWTIAFRHPDGGVKG
jgi:hypothetical protein